jgi:hypothetical protein
VPRRSRALQSTNILFVQANRCRDHPRHTLTIQQNKQTRNDLKEPRRLCLSEGEAVLIAEIDWDQIVRGKYALDVVGDYARPTFFSFM